MQHDHPQLVTLSATSASSETTRKDANFPVMIEDVDLGIMTRLSP